MRRTLPNPVIDKFIKIHFLHKSPPLPNTHDELKY